MTRGKEVEIDRTVVSSQSGTSLRSANIGPRRRPQRPQVNNVRLQSRRNLRSGSWRVARTNDMSPLRGTRSARRFRRYRTCQAYWGCESKRAGDWALGPALIKLPSSPAGMVVRTTFPIVGVKHVRRGCGIGQPGQVGYPSISPPVFFPAALLCVAVVVVVALSLSLPPPPPPSPPPPSHSLNTANRPLHSLSGPSNYIAHHGTLRSSSNRSAPWPGSFGQRRRSSRPPRGPAQERRWDLRPSGLRRAGPGTGEHDVRMHNLYDLLVWRTNG